MNIFDKYTSTKSDQLFVYVAYGISILILGTLFVENFVFSSGFDILRFREIDDMAFQDTLRRIHLMIEAGKFGHLFVVNDYAYGWVFWFPLALITYPLYLVSAHFAIDWPLIVAPRQMSLAFGIATLLLMRNIFKRYGAPEYVAAAVFLVLLLFPSFGYFSLRFGTVNEVMFFSALSLYFAVRENNSSSRGRRFAVAALALAGGVKLSGLLISPLIVALIALRYEFKSFSVFARDLVLSTALFVVLLIVFSNPSLLAYIFRPELGQKYVKTLSYFIGVTKLATGPLDPFEKFYSVFFGSIFNTIYTSILFFGLIIYAIKSKIHRFDMLAIICIILAVIAYLFYSVNNGAGLYFTSISFLLIFGLLCFCGFRGEKFF